MFPWFLQKQWGGSEGWKKLAVWFSINCNKHKDSVIKSEGL